ncbi:MAG: fused MFS/spermidine synthase [Herbiconiux sp.]|nr:fused MFS/spermidine synthase [Herbiconiux sp.]
MAGRRSSFSLELSRHRAKLVLTDRRTESYELSVGGIPQSTVSLRFPELLDYPYVRHIARVIDAAAPPGEPLRLVHLGAGALTLPRYAAATRPGSPQLVVEFEPALYEAVVAALPLPAGSDIRMLAGDARALAEQSPNAEGWHDAAVTVVDLWDAARIAARVASAEFYGAVAGRMAPGGVMAVNLLDGGSFEWARGQAATLASLRPHVAVVLDSEPGGAWPEPDNVVVLASDAPLAVVAHPELLDDPDAEEPRPHILSGARLTEWIAGAAVVTDATAVDSPDPDDPRFTPPRR